MIAFVQCASVIGNANPTAVLGAAPTDGNLLVAMGTHWNNAVAVQNGYTLLYLINGNTNSGLMVAYKIAAGDTANQTPFVTGGAAQTLTVFEVSGAMGSPMLVTQFKESASPAPSLTGFAPLGSLVLGQFTQAQSNDAFTLSGDTSTAIDDITGNPGTNGPYRVQSFEYLPAVGAVSVTANLSGAHDTYGIMVEIPGLPAEGLFSPEAGVLAAYNVPAMAMRSSEAGALSAFRETANNVRVDSGGAAATFHQTAQLRVAQAGMLAVVRGRVADPKLRVWTFTLDGHDFFVLRLGDNSTLLYDVYSEQWIEWDSKDSGAWRPNVGMTWVGGQALADTYGSSIVVGDDTFGLLWFLDPEQPFDDAPDALNERQQIEFKRIVTAQALASGRQQIPCYAVFLDGDNYGLTGTEFTPGIVLEFSDDQGRNFITSETLPVNPDPSVNNPYSWYSLGQFGSPGRIFRWTDNGVMARIDSASMNDDA